MNGLNLAENIVGFRHEKKITQEQLADFIGVTKAAVSKWETRQSTPDIMLLPRLAAYFDVTVDRLLGYEPQLSKEQIQKVYHDLAADFAEKAFEETIEKCEKLIRQYYSCYPFLFRICVLYLNHYSMAQETERQTALLNRITEIAVHVRENCRDVNLCSDAIIMEATALLLLKQPQRVIENTEDILRPNRLAGQSDTLLIDAYMMNGQPEQAEGFAQVSLYRHIACTIATAMRYIGIHQNQWEICRETIRRTEAIIEAWNISSLLPNSTVNFYYSNAILCCMHQKPDQAVEYLKKCVRDLKLLLAEPRIHGDDFFNKLEIQLEKYGVDDEAPRNLQMITRDIRQLCAHPAFAVLEDHPAYRALKQELEEM